MDGGARDVSPRDHRGLSLSETDDAALLGRIAVVIVAYNTADLLRRCLYGLRSDGGGRVQVIVVDNGSNDETVAVATAAMPPVELVEAGTNLGFGRAVNLAARQVERDYLVTLNPDCLPTPAVLLQLARRLDRESRLGYAGPRIVKPSGRPDAACLRGDPDPFGALLYFTRVARLFPRSPGISRYNLTYLDYEKEQPLLCGTGACLMFRTSAFRAVGGFDEAFFMYGEDLDICRRLRAAGHPGIYVPGAEVLHVKGEASRKESQRMLREFHRAMWIYYRRHEAAARPALVNSAVRAGIAVLEALRLARNALRREKRVSER